jgi:hypothetical protein
VSRGLEGEKSHWFVLLQIPSVCCRERSKGIFIHHSLIQKAQKVKKDKFKNKEDSSNKRDNWWNAKL